MGMTRHLTCTLTRVNRSRSVGRSWVARSVSSESKNILSVAFATCYSIVTSYKLQVTSYELQVTVCADGHVCVLSFALYERNLLGYRVTTAADTTLFVALPICGTEGVCLFDLM